MDLTDQILGCIIGGAIGDGMGGPYEGHSGPVTVHHELRWLPSDDTQMTLATCEAITEFGEVNPEMIADRYVRWFKRNRITGMGASTMKALCDLAAGMHWSMAGRKGEMAAGNGTAMRIAPLAFLLDPDKENHRELIRDVCRITHHNEEAYVGALAVVRAIRTVIQPNWDWSQNLLTHVAATLPDTKVRDRMQTLGTLDKPLSVYELGLKYGCSGYVVDSVPLAIYGAQKISKLNFGQVMEQVIAAGGDADTNASIAGQIAGASVGFKKLPNDLVQRIPNGDKTMQITQEFAESLCAVQ